MLTGVSGGSTSKGRSGAWGNSSFSSEGVDDDGESGPEDEINASGGEIRRSSSSNSVGKLFLVLFAFNFRTIKLFTRTFAIF